MRFKPAQSLQLLRALSVAMVRDDGPDLTLRQMAILLIVYLEPPPHSVRGLASRLGVTKPVITRALDTMGRLNLVDRRRDETDRRNVVIRRTVDGSLYLDRLSDLVSQIAGEIE